jgi:hypothetical protein
VASNALSGAEAGASTAAGELQFGQVLVHLGVVAVEELPALVGEHGDREGEQEHRADAQLLVEEVAQEPEDGRTGQHLEGGGQAVAEPGVHVTHCSKVHVHVEPLSLVNLFAI